MFKMFKVNIKLGFAESVEVSTHSGLFVDQINSPQSHVKVFHMTV